MMIAVILLRGGTENRACRVARRRASVMRSVMMADGLAMQAEEIGGLPEVELGKLGSRAKV